MDLDLVDYLINDKLCMGFGIYMELSGSWTNRVVIGTVDLSEFLFSFSSIRGEGIWFGYFERMELF